MRKKIMAQGFQLQDNPSWVNRPLRHDGVNRTKTNTRGQESDGITIFKELGKMSP